MKYIKTFVIILFFLILFPSVNSISIDLDKENIQSENYRFIEIDTATAMSKNAIGSAEFRVPDTVVIEDGIYPVIVEWNIDLYYKEDRGEIYRVYFTNIAKTSVFRKCKAWLNDSTWPGYVEANFYVFDVYSTFFSYDAGKTKNVDIIIEITNTYNNKVYSFKKTVKVVCGKVKRTKDNTMQKSIQDYDFFKKYNQFKDKFFFIFDRLSQLLQFEPTYDSLPRQI